MESPPISAANPSEAPKKKEGRMWLWVCIFVPLIIIGGVIFGLPYLMAPQHPCKNACVNNLMQIDGAKEQWALENKKSAGTPVTKADEAEINKFIKGAGMGLKCPSGDPNAVYIYGAIDTPPKCTFNKTPGEVHALPK